jgi:hypothetical protein
LSQQQKLLLSQVAAQLDRNGRVTVGELVLWWNS